MSCGRNYQRWWDNSELHDTSVKAYELAASTGGLCSQRNDYYDRMMVKTRPLCVLGNGSKRHRVDNRQGYVRLAGYDQYP